MTTDQKPGAGIVRCSRCAVQFFAADLDEFGLCHKCCRECGHRPTPATDQKPIDGGPAFPSHGTMGEVAHEGMKLRDYFAAKALPEFIRQSDDVGMQIIRDTLKKEGLSNVYALVARRSYDLADAMLAERAKGGGA